MSLAKPGTVISSSSKYSFLLLPPKAAGPSTLVLGHLSQHHPTPFPLSWAVTHHSCAPQPWDSKPKLPYSAEKLHDGSVAKRGRWCCWLFWQCHVLRVTNWEEEEIPESRREPVSWDPTAKQSFKSRRQTDSILAKQFESLFHTSSIILGTLLLCLVPNIELALSISRINQESVLLPSWRYSTGKKGTWSARKPPLTSPCSGKTAGKFTV